MNIILQEKRHNNKRNMDYWANIAYFATPKNALNFVIEKEIREFWVEDLRVVVKKMDGLYKMVQGLNTKPLPELV